MTQKWIVPSSKLPPDLLEVYLVLVGKVGDWPARMICWENTKGKRILAYGILRSPKWTCLCYMRYWTKAQKYTRSVTRYDRLYDNYERREGEHCLTNIVQSTHAHYFWLGTKYERPHERERFELECQKHEAVPIRADQKPTAKRLRQ